MNILNKIISLSVAAASVSTLLVMPQASASDLDTALNALELETVINGSIALPTTLTNGASITWQSSDEDTVLACGNKAYGLNSLSQKTAVLSATATLGGASAKRSFSVTVPAFSYTGDNLFDEDFELSAGESLSSTTWRLDSAFMPNSSDETGANYMGVGTEGNSANHVYKIKRTDNTSNKSNKSYIHLNKDGLPTETHIIYETKIYVADQPKNASGNNILLNHWWCRDMGNTIGKYSGFAAAYVGGDNGIQIKATLDSAPNTASVTSSVGTWRTLTFDVQSGVGSFDAYIDGEKVATDYKMRAQGAPLKHLAFGFDGNTTGEVWLDDVKIYEYPKTAEDLLDGKGLGVTDTDAVEDNLVLPEVEGTSITWVSDSPEVVSSTGEVNTESLASGTTKAVKLYAIVNNGGYITKKCYDLTVLKKEVIVTELDFIDMDEVVGEQSKTALTSGFELPTKTQIGTSISWSSDNTSVIAIRDNSYAVIKPSTVSQTAILTASTTVDGKVQTRTFTLTVAPGKAVQNEIDITKYLGQDASNVVNDFDLPATTPSGKAVQWSSDTPDSLFVYNNHAYVIRKSDPTAVSLIADVENDGVVNEFKYPLTIGTVDEITDFLVDEDFESTAEGDLPTNDSICQWGKDLTVVDGNQNIVIGVQKEDGADNKVMNVHHIEPDGTQHSLLHINFNTPKKGSVVIMYRYKYIVTGVQGKDTNANIWINSTTGYNAASSSNFVKFPFNDTFVVAQMGGNRSNRVNYTGGQWHSVKAILNLDDGIFDMYLDGEKKCENEPKIEGDGAMRIQVGFDRGSAGHCQIDDVKVYMDPVSIVKNYAASIDLGDLTNVVKDLEIPTKTPLGDADILWVSSNPEIISTTGVVNNPANGKDASVTLWALVESGNNRALKQFDVNVAKVLSDEECVTYDYDNLFFTPPTPYCLDSTLRLPTVGEKGSTITWESSNPEIISSTGAVNPLPYNNEAISKVTLTATVSKGDVKSASKSYTINVPERNYVLDATVTGSSDCVNGRYEFIKDNDSSTAWAPQDGDKNQYLTIDLKSVKTINKIVINGTPGDVAVSYRADSGSTYTRLGTGASLLFTPRDAKSVKLEFTKASNVSSVGIYYYISAQSAVESDIAALSLYNLDNVTGDIKIPTVGSVCGSTITAVSSNQKVLTNTGKVTRPSDADATLTLSLTFTYEGYSKTVDYTVKVLKKKTSSSGGGGGGGSSGYGGSASSSGSPIVPQVSSVATGSEQLVSYLLSAFSLKDSTTVLNYIMALLNK